MELDIEKGIVDQLKTLVSGTADATEANKLHDADGGFTSDMAGAICINTTDSTSAEITAFVDSGELTLASDIMENGESYRISFFDDGYIFDPDRELDELTRPFFVVKVLDSDLMPLSFIDDAATARTDRLMEERYLIWLYIYPRDDVLEMRELPRNAILWLYQNVTVSSIAYRVENLRCSFVGSENEADNLRRRMSVIQFEITNYRQVA